MTWRDRLRVNCYIFSKGGLRKLISRVDRGRCCCLNFKHAKWNVLHKEVLIVVKILHLQLLLAYEFDYCIYLEWSRDMMAYWSPVETTWTYGVKCIHKRVFFCPLCKRIWNYKIHFKTFLCINAYLPLSIHILNGSNTYPFYPRCICVSPPTPWSGLSKACKLNL